MLSFGTYLLLEIPTHSKLLLILTSSFRYIVSQSLFLRVSLAYPNGSHPGTQYIFRTCKGNKCFQNRNIDSQSYLPPHRTKRKLK